MRSIQRIAIAVVLIAPIACAETDGETVTIGPGEGGTAVDPMPRGGLGDLSQSLEVSDARIAGEMGQVQFAGVAVAEWAMRDAEWYSLGLSVLDSNGYALTMVDFRLDLEELVGAGPQSFAFGAQLQGGFAEWPNTAEGSPDEMEWTGEPVEAYFNVTGCSGPASGEVDWDVPAEEVTVDVALDPDDSDLLVVTFSAAFPDVEGVQVTDGSFSIPVSEASGASVSTGRTQE